MNKKIVIFLLVIFAIQIYIAKGQCFFSNEKQDTILQNLTIVEIDETNEAFLILVLFEDSYYTIVSLKNNQIKCNSTIEIGKTVTSSR